MSISPALVTGRDYTALPLRRRLGWVVMLGSLTAIGAFTIDLYLPAFPLLERELSASASTVQLTLTGTMFGVALGQLVVGPLADAIGRRRPLLVGLVLHLVSSLLVAVAPSIAVLGVLRVLQGLGTAAASVIALAIVRDRFEGRGAAQLIARLMLIVGASPLFAPSVGSVLLGVTGWRGIFVVLGIMSLLLVVAVWFAVPESLPVEQRRPTGPRLMAVGYARLLRDPAMLGLVLLGGLAMAALFAFVADSSFVFQQQFGLSHFGFGIAFAGGGFFVIVGTQANGSLVHRFSSQAMLTGALVAALAGAAVLVATTSTGIFGLAGVLVPLYVTLLALGLAMPNPPVLALERYSATAGTAAALVGAGQFGIASATAPLGSLLSSALGMTPATAMAVVIAAGLALSLVAMALLVRPGMRSAPPEAPEATAPRQEDVATASRTEEAHRSVAARPAPAAEAARRAARPSSRRRPVGAGRRSER